MTKKYLTQKEKKNLKIALGKSIRSKREKMNLSQEKLGYEANIHRTYIGAIERGERNASIEILGTLALVLGCNLSDIMPEQDEYRRA